MNFFVLKKVEALSFSVVVYDRSKFVWNIIDHAQVMHLKVKSDDLYIHAYALSLHVAYLL